MKFQDWLMFYGVPLSLIIIGALAIMFGFYLWLGAWSVLILVGLVMFIVGLILLV